MDRRKHNRFDVKDGGFAAIMPMPSKVGPIINISKGGVLFNYIDDIENEEHLCESNELELLLVGKSLHVDKLLCKTISDFLIPKEYSFNYILLRRSAMQFVKLTRQQELELQYFINKYAVIEEYKEI